MKYLLITLCVLSNVFDNAVCNFLKFELRNYEPSYSLEVESSLGFVCSTPDAK